MPSDQGLPCPLIESYWILHFAHALDDLNLSIFEGTFSLDAAHISKIHTEHVFKFTLQDIHLFDIKDININRNLQRNQLYGKLIRIAFCFFYVL